MKVRTAAFASPERNTLFQKLRLAGPSLRHGTRINLSFAVRDADHVADLDPEMLRRWAGPQLGELVAEVGRAGRASAGGAEVVIAKTAAGPQEAAELGLRAQIFGELVRFALAERRLAGAQRTPVVAAGDGV